MMFCWFYTLCSLHFVHLPKNLQTVKAVATEEKNTCRPNSQSHGPTLTTFTNCNVARLRTRSPSPERSQKRSQIADEELRNWQANLRWYAKLIGWKNHVKRWPVGKLRSDFISVMHIDVSMTRDMQLKCIHLNRGLDGQVTNQDRDN